MTYIQRSWHFDDAQNWTSQEHVKYYPPNGMILFIQSEVQEETIDVQVIYKTIFNKTHFYFK
jgi:hypothetical protein